jgi:hypothetical protein
MTIKGKGLAGSKQIVCKDYLCYCNCKRYRLGRNIVALSVFLKLGNCFLFCFRVDLTTKKNEHESHKNEELIQ